MRLIKFIQFQHLIRFCYIFVTKHFKKIFLKSYLQRKLLAISQKIRLKHVLKLYRLKIFVKKLKVYLKNTLEELLHMT